MAFDINNFVINKVRRGVMLSSADNSVLWSLSQMTNTSLSVTTETQDAVDALGSPIMTFERAKTCEFSAENSLMDLGLMGAQGGTDKIVATATNTVIAIAFDEPTTDATNTITLEHAPTGIINSINVINGDDSLGTKYTNATTASATNFVHTSGSDSITLPTGMAEGTRLLIIYDYETDAAVEVQTNAVDFPKAGRFVMEVWGADVCNQTEVIHAYVEFPNAKLMGNYDLSFATDSTHPFTIQCQQQYCDVDKKLFRVIIPDQD